MVLVKRIWSKKSQISEHTELLDIWDTGSHIFERWPNGDEIYWKIISREENENGFIETLEKQPTWQMPGEVLRKEQIPLLQSSASHFQPGSWSVEQVTEEQPYSTPSLKGHSMLQAQKPRAHMSQAHMTQAHMHKRQVHKPQAYSHRTSLSQNEVKGQCHSSQVQ